MDLPTWEPPEWHPSIDSTNLEAARDPRPGRVVVADHQSAGLGRRGRSWTAPPDTSVAISVVLPAPGPGLIGWVPLVAGLAVAQALEDSRYAVPAVLKWPNDVLVREGGRGKGAGSESGPVGDGWGKVCGILAQALPGARGGPLVVLGAGINIDQTRDQLPVPTATSWRLARGGGAPLPDGAREQLVVDYLDRLRGLLGELVGEGTATPGASGGVGSATSGASGGGGSGTSGASGGGGSGTSGASGGGGSATSGASGRVGDGVRTAYSRRCSTLGQLVRVHLPEGGERTGTAVEIDPSGALVVEGDGRRTVHLAGDVVHVRAAG